MGEPDHIEFDARPSTAAEQRAFVSPMTGQRLEPFRRVPIQPAQIRVAQIAALPLPTAPGVEELPSRKPPRAYFGPSGLAPECIGHLEQYYREQPGAYFKKLVRVLCGVGLVAGLSTAILALALLIRSHPFADHVAGPAPIQHPGQIGILNPAWLDSKVSNRGVDHGTLGFFDAGAGDVGATPQPSKYIYVAPDEAQRILEVLIGEGVVTAVGAHPNVVRDFAKLKGIGITTD